MTPNDAACRIVVDGEPYAWRDGEAVVFDETYVHHAENGTGRDRLILFCDVERPLRGRVPRAVNRWLGDHLMRATRGANDATEQVGAVSAAFSRVYEVRLLGKRIKAWNRNVYYGIKYALLVALAWAFFA